MVSTSYISNNNSSNNNNLGRKPTNILIPQEIQPLSEQRLNTIGTKSAEKLKTTEEFKSMDLGGWNSDLDSSLLNFMNGNTETNSQGGSDRTDKKKNGHLRSNSSTRSSPRDDGTSSWDGNLNHWSRLPSFSVDYEGTPSEKSKLSEVDGSKISQEDTSSYVPQNTAAAQQTNANATHQGVRNHAAAVSGDAVSATSSIAGRHGPTVSAATSVVSGSRDASSVAGLSEMSGHEGDKTTEPQSSGNNNPLNTTQLHPLGIQSLASCPPYISGNVAPSGNHPIPNSQFGQIARLLQQVQQTMPFDFSPLHGVDGSNVASLAASLQQAQAANAARAGASHTRSSQHLESLAANFILAHAGSSTAAVANGTAQVQHAPSPQVVEASNLILSNNSGSHTPTPRVQQATEPSPPAAATTSSSQSGPSTATKASQDQQQQQQQSQQNSPKSMPQQQEQRSQMPPFYLFDAPIELRANFMQSQRQLGIPIQQDCNSYHYGETVKGFHPQQLLTARPSEQHQTGSAPPQLIDARHGCRRQKGVGRVKNEREQKRAQKITELIEQLRVTMEHGGWKVEMRSKFHTLSSCADYVKHMIKETKGKEENLEKLKAELEVKQQKIEEDKALQESRSDPESVTSSLTSSTSGSGNMRSKAKTEKKRKGGDDTGDKNENKKRRLASRHMSSISTTEDSSADNSASRDTSAQGSDDIDKTVSSVSELTDSNRATSSRNSGSASGSGSDGATLNISRVSADEEEQPSSSSISSDAAVASIKSSRDRPSGGHNHDHKDVVFTQDKRQDRKRPPEEVTSTERSFELDYEELFKKSNLPQLIAATSGKIVTFNECFLRATGLRRSEVEHMTLFSLVKPDKLSNFFEIVAEALRPPEENKEPKNDKPSTEDETAEKTEAEGEEKHAHEGTKENEKSSKRQCDYAAMTLPCVVFPAMKKRREEEKNIDPLHVTVTLMADNDPSLRFFHCVFTDCPGTDGTLGCITPDLLAALFSEAEGKRRHKSRSRRMHKRSRKNIQHTSPEEESATTQEESFSFKGSETQDESAGGGESQQGETSKATGKDAERLSQQSDTDQIMKEG